MGFRLGVTFLTATVTVTSGSLPNWQFQVLPAKAAMAGQPFAPRRPGAGASAPGRGQAQARGARTPRLQMLSNEGGPFSERPPNFRRLSDAPSSSIAMVLRVVKLILVRSIQAAQNPNFS
jgi:hypothetical protein